MEEKFVGPICCGDGEKLLLPMHVLRIQTQPAMHAVHQNVITDIYRNMPNLNWLQRRVSINLNRTEVNIDAINHSKSEL